jgi:hypothetical protein
LVIPLFRQHGASHQDLLDPIQCNSIVPYNTDTLNDILDDNYYNGIEFLLAWERTASCRYVVLVALTFVGG